MVVLPVMFFAVMMSSVAVLAQQSTPFSNVIIRLNELGFFQFVLPFLLTAAIFYGLLRKSQIFGKPEENVAVNAIVALIAGFMVWAYPIIAGVDIQTTLSTFFFQGSIAMLSVIIVVLIAGMFLPPDLPKKVGEVVKGGKGLGVTVIGGGIIVFIVVISSGVGALFIPAGLFTGGGFGFGFGGLDQTTVLSAITILAMSAVVLGIVWGSGSGGGKKE